jgi:hypothetical protein
MTRLQWWLLTALIVSIGSGTIMSFAVPGRTFQNAEWFGLELRKKELRIPVDATIQRMIRRAKIDSWMNPAAIDFGGTEGRRRYRRIYFDRAWRAEPSDVYLMFGTTTADIVVIYCGSLENGKLFWKAVEAEP